jgi:hypothetical protein
MMFVGFVGFVGGGMKISRFEDIEAWKEARQLVQQVYGAIKGNNEFQRDFRPPVSG